MSVPSGEGLLDLGGIEIDLSSLETPVKAVLSVTAVAQESGNHVNTWPLWIYPSSNMPDRTGVLVKREIDGEALSALQDGGRVLLMPSDTAGAVGGLFQTDYWNYAMFKRICENNHKPVSPGTLGILTDPSHPLFREFPSDGHTNWQWFPVLKASHPRILDSLRGYRPLVQVIDNIERNHRLGLVYEFAVGKGKLLVCCSDPDSAMAYPEGRQFYKALLDYMRSGDFNPSWSLSPGDLEKLFQ